MAEVIKGTAPEAEKMVRISEAQLDKMLERLEKLEKGAGQALKPKRVTQSTADLRLWNEKLVIGYNKVYQVLNPMTQALEEKIELLLKDETGTEILEAGYLDFLNNAAPVTVKILEQKASIKEVVENTVNLVSAKDDRIFPDQAIDLIVTTVEYTSKVEVLDGKFKGQVLTIKNKLFNM